MNRPICTITSATLRFVCALIFGFLPLFFLLLGLCLQARGQLVLGQQVWSLQALPPLHTVNVPNFSIPFEFDSTDWAKSIKDVELLVSQDRGRHWNSVARQPVESKRFAFQADTDGEYWFAFRTIMQSGTVNSVSGQPQLRVLVVVKSSLVHLPSQASESGPVLPPKPARYKNKQTSRVLPSPQATQADASQTNRSHDALSKKNSGEKQQPTHKSGNAWHELEQAVSEEKKSVPAEIIAPKFPGMSILEMTENHEKDMLDTLLNGMDPFIDVQPVITQAFPSEQLPAEKTSPIETYADSSRTSYSLDLPAGKITGILLNKDDPAQQKIVVKWNTGYEFWHDAQIDIFRSSARDGDRIPIAINLANSGEYWWFLSPKDLKPFYITICIRSLFGGTHTDVTQSPISIETPL